MIRTDLCIKCQQVVEISRIRQIQETLHRKCNNSFADVVDLELSTTISGNRVVLENKPQTENSLLSNSDEPNKTSNTSGSVLNEILKRMESHRNSLVSLRADIKFTSYNSTLDESETSEGSAICLFSSIGRSILKINWTKPATLVFSVVDDKYVIYDPRTKTAVYEKIYR